MRKSFVRMTSGALIACMAALPLHAQAGLIGTDAVTIERAQSSRQVLSGMLARTDAAAKLQSFGLTAQQAQARLAALTDVEVALLADRVERLPAGADGSGIGLLVILIFLVYHF